MFPTPPSRSAMSSVRRFALAPPSRLCTRTAAQWFCLVVGVLLALRGEGWRASQQLLTALLLLLGQRTQRGARLVLIPFALFYAVLAIVGDINGHEAFGLLPIDTRDKFVHPVYAVLALALLAAGWQRDSARRGR